MKSRVEIYMKVCERRQHVLQFIRDMEYKLNPGDKTSVVATRLKYYREELVQLHKAAAALEADLS